MKIKIEELHKSFNHNHVLRGVNLEVESAQTTVIIGGSGCGKSVLLKHIIGLLKPDSGRIYIDGQEITSLDEQELEPIRRRFGMVFQSSALLNSLTVRENVALALKENRLSPQEEIERIVDEKLGLVGLRYAGERLPAELSGGMKKRVAIARALATNPKILLFDEPTSELDPPMAKVINEQMLDLKNRLQITSIVVTHDMNHAYTIGDKIGMLYEGKIVQVGTPEQIRDTTIPAVSAFIVRDEWKEHSKK